MKLTKKTIFIIDDDSAVCHALSCLFESVNFNVETYNTGHAFLDKYDGNKSGCLIVDVRMPVMSGLKLIESLNDQKSNLPIIMISGYSNIEVAVQAMKLGAVDFILKPFNEQCLLDIVQKHTNVPFATNIMEEKEAIANITKRVNLLSTREKQIIDLIVEGKLNKEMAYILSISMSTVEAHRANIMRKMQVKNLAQLIKVYLKFQHYTA